MASNLALLWNRFFGQLGVAYPFGKTILARTERVFKN